MTKPIRVLIVEGHGIVREGVRLLLQEAEDVVVVGEAREAAGALRAVERLAGAAGLDLVLTELELPDMDGQELARRLKAAHPGLRVIFLSLLPDDDRFAGVLAGVGDGYVLKQAAAQELLAAIRTVIGGEMYFSPAITRWALQRAREGPLSAWHSDRLSGREREVLGLLIGGLTSKEVAPTLGLHTKTAESHRASILAKLGVANTAAVGPLACEEGLLAAQHDGTV